MTFANILRLLNKHYMNEGILNSDRYQTLKVLLCSWLNAISLKNCEDFQIRHWASVWHKGLQNFQSPSLFPILIVLLATFFNLLYDLQLWPLKSHRRIEIPHNFLNGLVSSQERSSTFKVWNIHSKNPHL